ncbi:hypothetical protein AVEN_116454-1 [Araneus ventricosus]|uniref:Uncharacterized protein n=1 Tax=Araneus ventricosus TaxID=182803 RepID=A0A4Y2V0C5_ARAVE|nr:hypothetical protein AVEN_119858-1 [Araneus ventricosus]GBO17814.1 hypothetical protein AVEN_116454-1 [Araneus ventricosus]
MSISSPACTADQTPTDRSFNVAWYLDFFRQDVTTHRFLSKVLDISAPSRDRTTSHDFSRYRFVTKVAKFVVKMVAKIEFHGMTPSKSSVKLSFLS